MSGTSDHLTSMLTTERDSHRRTAAAALASGAATQARGHLQQAAHITALLNELDALLKASD